MSVTIHPMTPDRWGDLETLFDSAGVTRTCWCMWWRLPDKATWDATAVPARRDAFRALAQQGRAPGLLAYDGGTAVGWAQVTPRTEVPRFNKGRASRPEPGTDLGATWALSCFFIASTHRGQGVMTALARAACDFAAGHGAACVEAAAHDPEGPLLWSDGYTGLVPALLKAGFAVAGPRLGRRVPMRWTPA